MKECIKCRQELADDAVFCHACGAKQVQEPKKCFKCGHPIPDGGTFCSNCGTRQDSEMEQSKPAHPKPMQSQQTVYSEYPSSEIPNVIQYLKEIPTELKAVAVCFLLIPFFRIPEFYFVVEPVLKQYSITAHPIMVFGLICCVLTCLSSIAVGVLIFIKKENFLLFAFSPILLIMLADYITAFFFPNGAALFLLQILILPAYILITLDSFKIYINKPLLPKSTKLYAIAALIIAVIIRKFFNLFHLCWDVDSLFFLSAGFIIWLVYILRHNNKIQ